MFGTAILLLGLWLVQAVEDSAGDEADDEASPQAQTAELETLIVTGTRIRERGGETIAPVAVFTGEELKQRGYTTLGEFSRELTFNAGAIDEFINPFGGGRADGSASFNLRGLGVDATLNLIDGRRVVSAGAGTSTELDLNSIPVALVDRVEILKDGASAIYGAEAIAGVINIILRKDFLGTELEVSARDTLEHDALEYTVTGSFGRYIGSGSVWGFISHFERNASYLRDVEEYSTRDLRLFAGEFGDRRTEFSSPPNYIVLSEDGIFYYGDPACEGRGTGGRIGSTPTYEPNFGYPPFIQVVTDHACVYDQAKDGVFAHESTRSTVMLGFDAPTGDHSVFGEFYYNERDTRGRFAPQVAFGFDDGFFGLPIVGPDHPSNPFGEPVALFFAPLDVGLKIGTNEFELYRLAVGLKGTLGDWHYEATLYGSNEVEDRRFINRIVLDRFVAALEGRGGPSGDRYYNPFHGAVNDPDLVAWMVDDALHEFETEVWVADAFVTRELFQWRYGISSFAAGLEHRQLDDRPFFDSDGFLGLPTFGQDAPGALSRDVESAYSELTLPVYRDMELQLAARHEDFSDFGSATTPKAALRWKVNDHLILRGSYSEAFKAPSLGLLLDLSSVPYLDFYADPIRCDNPALADLPECAIGGLVEIRELPNLAIQPEQATSEVLGLVFTPPGLPRLGIDLDWWRFDYYDRIEFLGLDQIADYFADDPRYVTRAPPSDEDIALGVPGRVTELRPQFINFARLETEGVDVAVNWDTVLRKIGSIGLEAQATYYSDYAFTQSFGEDPNERVGVDLSRWRAHFGLSWWRGDDALRFSLAYASANFIPNEDRPLYHLDDWWSLNITYQHHFRGWNSAQLRIGCLQCLAQDVQRDEDGFGTTDVIDPRGRALSASLRVSF